MNTERAPWGLVIFILAVVAPIGLLGGGWDRATMMMAGSVAVGSPVGYVLARRALAIPFRPRWMLVLSALAGGFSLLFFLPALALVSRSIDRVVQLPQPPAPGFLFALSVAVLNGGFWTIAVLDLAPRAARADAEQPHRVAELAADGPAGGAA